MMGESGHMPSIQAQVLMKVFASRFSRVCARPTAESPTASELQNIFNSFELFLGANCAVSLAGSFRINFS
jgi:hypothetical protein